MKIANSFVMWLACGIAVSIVVIQAVVFGKSALSAGLFSWLPGVANYLVILTSVFLAIVLTLIKYNKNSN